MLVSMTKEKNGYLVDLSHKILIFLDQPHNELLARLRPLLSHDKKGDCNQNHRQNTKERDQNKEYPLRGYPSVIFCTAGLRIDEQEQHVSFYCRPKSTKKRYSKVSVPQFVGEADGDSFVSCFEENPDRALLKERIRAIKLENVKEINITSPEKIEEQFLSKNKTLKPRHQRDIKRLLALIKSFALLNVWWRERDGSTITANEEDIREALHFGTR